MTAERSPLAAEIRATIAVAAPLAVANLAQAYVLDQLTTVGELWHREGENIRCVACGHRCLVKHVFHKCQIIGLNRLDHGHPARALSV